MGDNVDYNQVASWINDDIDDGLNDISDAYASVNDGLEIVGRINAIRSSAQSQDVLSSYTMISQTAILADIASLSGSLEGIQAAVTAEGAQKQKELEEKLAAEKKAKEEQDNSNNNNNNG